MVNWSIRQHVLVWQWERKNNSYKKFRVFKNIKNGLFTQGAGKRAQRKKKLLFFFTHVVYFKCAKNNVASLTGEDYFIWCRNQGTEMILLFCRIMGSHAWLNFKSSICFVVDYSIGVFICWSIFFCMKYYRYVFYMCDITKFRILDGKILCHKKWWE